MCVGLLKKENGTIVLHNNSVQVGGYYYELECLGLQMSETMTPLDKTKTLGSLVTGSPDVAVFKVG